MNLYQYEFDALVSLLFNLGSLRKAPLLKSKLNSGDYAGAADEFLDITNDGTTGLVTRRRKRVGFIPITMFMILLIDRM